MESQMISPAAEKEIDKMKDFYTLNSEQFKRFFFTEIYAKHSPNILPIVRSFTEDIDGVIFQLHYFKDSLDSAHKEYMAKHSTDEKLRRMLNKLVKSLEAEMKSEKKEGRCQRSMCEYTKKMKYTTTKSFRLTSKAEELITHLPDEVLNPVNFKKFLFQAASRKSELKVLPILRSFTTNVKGVIRQLRDLRKLLRDDHKMYMVEHEKDKNVCNRINKLIENIEKDQKQEERERRSQGSMRDYVKMKNN